MILLFILQWSLSESVDDSEITKIQKKGTVPYILQLIYLSSTLLSSICTDLTNICKCCQVQIVYHNS